MVAVGRWLMHGYGVRMKSNHLMEIGLVTANGTKYDPGRVYSGIIK